MSKKEKNVEMGSPMKMPDLASYMQTVIEQLEADKKRSAAHTYTYALKSIAEFYGGLLPVHLHPETSHTDL